MSADLYPQSAYTTRPAYQQRADQPYQLSTSSNVASYSSQLLPSQQSTISDSQSAHDAHSQSPQRESQSPKQEDNGSVPKQEGTPQQQPAKPQATFLTKLYAYVASCYMRALIHSPSIKAPREAREPPHDPLGSRGRAHHRRAARAARPSCSPQRLPPVALCKLLPAIKRKSASPPSSRPFFREFLPTLTCLISRSTASCVRSTSETLTPRSTTLTRAPGVRRTVPD